MTHIFQPGDTVYFYNGDTQRMPGTIKLLITKELLGYPEDYYIIEAETHMGEHLVIRPVSRIYRTRQGG